MKIAQIVGARPQFIKYLPVSKAIAEFNISSGQRIEDILIHTGQHYDYKMSKIFFKELGIKQPKYHLGVGSGSHGMQTGKILERSEEVLLKERPDIAMVYGDTNSTLSGALAAIKLRIPIAHVEAGLRSYNKYMPEEVNRIVTDHVSSILLCPTETTVNNLKKEGFSNIINEGKLIDIEYHLTNIRFDISQPLIVNVGDVMYDTLFFSLKIAEKKSRILEKLNLKENAYCILTIHRAENTDNIDKLKEIIDFVNNVSVGNTVIFPIHPRTKKSIGMLKRKSADNIKMIEPLSYFDTLMLLKNSKLVLTDSGGLQKEAYWLKIPCITLRKETEWLETLEGDWNILYQNYKGTHKPKAETVVLDDDKRVAKKIINIIINTVNKEK